MNTSPRILVTGATGKTGRATAHALADNPNVQVRAMVRTDDDRAQSLRATGAEVVVGNLDDIRDVRNAMRDVQRAYFVAGFSKNSLDHGLNFAVAAAEQRLEHVVALGQWLSSPSHPSVATRRTWLTDRIMSWIPNVDHTIINVGWFADNTMPMLGVAAQLGVFPFPLGAGKNAPISNEDIGRVVAGVLANPADYAGRTLRPTGPELLTPQDIASVYGNVLGRDVRHQDMSLRMFSKALRALGMVPPLLQTQLLHYVQEYQRGAFASGGVTDVVERVTGAAAEDFTTITRRYAAADPFTARSLGNKLKAIAQFMKILITRAPDPARWERESGWPMLKAAEYCGDHTAWSQTHDTANAFGVSASPSHAPHLASVRGG